MFYIYIHLYYFLDSTYRWYQIVFAFLSVWLISLSITLPRFIHGAANGTIYFLWPSNIPLYTHTHTHTSLYIYVCMYMYTYTHTHTHTHIRYISHILLIQLRQEIDGAPGWTAPTGLLVDTWRYKVPSGLVGLDRVKAKATTFSQFSWLRALPAWHTAEEVPGRGGKQGGRRHQPQFVLPSPRHLHVGTHLGWDTHTHTGEGPESPETDTDTMVPAATRRLPGYNPDTSDLHLSYWHVAHSECPCVFFHTYFASNKCFIFVSQS